MGLIDGDVICRKCSAKNTFYMAKVTLVKGDSPAAEIGDTLIICDECDSLINYINREEA